MTLSRFRVSTTATIEQHNQQLHVNLSPTLGSNDSIYNELNTAHRREEHSITKSLTHK